MITLYFQSPFSSTSYWEKKLFLNPKDNGAFSLCVEPGTHVAGCVPGTRWLPFLALHRYFLAQLHLHPKLVMKMKYMNNTKCLT